MSLDNKNTHWGKSPEGLRVHIKNAIKEIEYICIGCKARLIVCHGDINEEYYRHHPKDSHLHINCTFSSETYRHHIAKKILLRLKEIKVKPLYVKIPDELGGGLQRIKDSQNIKAHFALKEKAVYEDENGNYTLDLRPEELGDKLGKRTLYFKPDVVFYNVNADPFLFIEIHATHKVNAEKKAKLINVKVDTIEVKIPPDFNEEDIENLFLNNTQFTNWLFNNEQYSAKYNPELGGPIQRDQDNIRYEDSILESEEDYTCTKFRLNQLIRRARNYMARDEFVKRKMEINADISRAWKTREELRSEYQGRLDQRERRIGDIKRRIENELMVSRSALRERNTGIREEAKRRLPGNLKEEERGIEQQIEHIDFEIKSLIDKQNQVERIMYGLSKRFTTIKERERESRYKHREIKDVESEIGYIEGGIEQYRNSERYIRGQEKELDIKENKSRTELDTVQSTYNGRKEAIEQLEREEKIAESELATIQETISRFEGYKRKISDLLEDLRNRRYSK